MSFKMLSKFVVVFSIVATCGAFIQSKVFAAEDGDTITTESTDSEAPVVVPPSEEETTEDTTEEAM